MSITHLTVTGNLGMFEPERHFFHVLPFNPSNNPRSFEWLISGTALPFPLDPSLTSAAKLTTG